MDTTYKNIFGFLISDNSTSSSTVYRFRLFCCSSALSATQNSNHYRKMKKKEVFISLKNE